MAPIAPLLLLVLLSSLAARTAAHGPRRAPRLEGEAAGDPDAPPPQHGHTCAHDRLRAAHPRIRRSVPGAQDYGVNAGRRLQAATYAPLRVRVETVGAGWAANAAASALVRGTLLPAATARLSAMLSITPVVGPLFAHRDCAGYDTAPTPARCVQYEASTDCANFAGEEPIYFTAAQLGADTVYTAGGGSRVLPAGSGFPDADFVVFATLSQSGVCGRRSTGGTIAYAWGCQRDAATDRPTIARINLCPDMMLGYAANTPAGVDVIMHELAHGMGFSADSWALWRYGDAARTPRTPRNPKFPFVPAASYRVDYACGGEAYWDYLPAGNTLSYFAERGMGACTPPGAAPFPSSNCVARLVTPAVRAAAQAFFDCPSLPGAELENLQSADDCALLGSHWEYRVFAGEMMSPYDVSQRQGFSAVTLAVFEDSGWGYKANWSAADQFIRDLDWGYRQGCGLAQERCLDTPPGGGALVGQGSPPHFHPARVMDGSLCRIDRAGYAGANVSTYGGALPLQYQYFAGQPRVGGGDRHGAPSMDYCPLVMPQSSSDRLCVDGHSASETGDLGMRPGADSLCMASSLRRAGAAVAPRGVGCYQAACAADGSLRVTATAAGGGGGTVSGVCRAAGQQLALPGFSGAVTCPDAPAICAPGPKDMTGVVIPAAAWLPASASPAHSATRTPGPPSATPSRSPVPVVSPPPGAVVLALCVAAAGALPAGVGAARLALDADTAAALRCELAAAAGGPPVTPATVGIQGFYATPAGTDAAVGLPAGYPWGGAPAPACAGAPAAAAYSSSMLTAATLLEGLCVYASVGVPAASASAAADASTVRLALNQVFAGGALGVGNAFQRTVAALAAAAQPAAGGGARNLSSADLVLRLGYLVGGALAAGGGGGDGGGYTPPAAPSAGLTTYQMMIYAAGALAGLVLLVSVGVYWCRRGGRGGEPKPPEAAAPRPPQRVRGGAPAVITAAPPPPPGVYRGGVPVAAQTAPGGAFYFTPAPFAPAGTPYTSQPPPSSPQWAAAGGGAGSWGPGAGPLAYGLPTAQQQQNYYGDVPPPAGRLAQYRNPSARMVPTAPPQQSRAPQARRGGGEQR